VGRDARLNVSVDTRQCLIDVGRDAGLNVSVDTRQCLIDACYKALLTVLLLNAVRDFVTVWMKEERSRVEHLLSCLVGLNLSADSSSD